MSLLFLSLAACTNLADPGWAGGGAHYASGEIYRPATDDTGGGDTGGTTLEEGAPELLTGSASYVVSTESGQLYISVGIAYDDDPDDMNGGSVYYDLYGDGDLLEEDDRIVTDDADADPNVYGLVGDGTLTFNLGPVDDGVTHTVDVFVTDEQHHESNHLEVEVTGE